MNIVRVKLYLTSVNRGRMHVKLNGEPLEEVFCLMENEEVIWYTE